MESLKSLDKKVKKLWYFVGAIIYLLCVISYVILLIFCQKDYLILSAILGGIFNLIVLAIVILYPYFKYKLYRYNYNDKKIYIEHGVIFRHRLTIPVCQIQDLHIYNGPIMSILHLSGIIISTAGSNFQLGAIAKADADSMVSDLLTKLENRLGDKASEEI